jgi:hypothetical protein
MPLWELLALGASAWFVFAVLVGCTLAAAFARIARGDMTQAEYEAFLDEAMWSEWPLRREAAGVVTTAQPSLSRHKAGLVLSHAPNQGSTSPRRIA